MSYLLRALKTWLRLIYPDLNTMDSQAITVAKGYLDGCYTALVHSLYTQKQYLGYSSSSAEEALTRAIARMTWNETGKAA